MNANEVIANLALERMGYPKGDYDRCDPHDCSARGRQGKPAQVVDGLARGVREEISTTVSGKEALHEELQHLTAILARGA